MEQQPTSMKSSSLWKGMVTKPSSLYSGTPTREMNLGGILSDYIKLREEKTRIGLERARLEQEKWRLNGILRSGRPNMSAYNAGSRLKLDQQFVSGCTTANITSLPYLSHSSITSPSVIHSVTGPNLAPPHPQLVSSAGCNNASLTSPRYLIHSSVTSPSTIHSVTGPNLAAPHPQVVSSAGCTDASLTSLRYPIHSSVASPSVIHSVTGPDLVAPHPQVVSSAGRTNASLTSLRYPIHSSVTSPSAIHSVTGPDLTAPHPQVVSSAGCNNASLTSPRYLSHSSVTSPSAIHSVTGPNLAAPHPQVVSSAGCTNASLTSLRFPIHSSVTSPSAIHSVAGPDLTASHPQVVSSAASTPLSTAIGQQKRKRIGLNAAVEDMSATKRVRRIPCPLPNGKKELQAKVGATAAASPWVSLTNVTPDHHRGNSSTQVVTPMDYSVVTTKTVIDLESNQEISSFSPMKKNLTTKTIIDLESGQEISFSSPLKNLTTNTVIDLENNQDISSSSPVKTTLNNLFDIDFPKIDSQYYQNFSISEVLADQLFGGEGFGFPCQPPIASNVPESADVIVIGDLWGWEW